MSCPSAGKPQVHLHPENDVGYALGRDNYNPHMGWEGGSVWVDLLVLEGWWWEEKGARKPGCKSQKIDYDFYGRKELLVTGRELTPRARRRSNAYQTRPESCTVKQVNTGRRSSQSLVPPLPRKSECSRQDNIVTQYYCCCCCCYSYHL